MTTTVKSSNVSYSGALKNIPIVFLMLRLKLKRVDPSCSSYNTSEMSIIGYPRCFIHRVIYFILLFKKITYYKKKVFVELPELLYALFVRR